MSKYRFEPTSLGYQVYFRGKSLGVIVPMQEATGRHCFHLGWDERAQPRTYRGKIKAAEALHAIHRLVTDAKSKKWSRELLIIQAWDQRPATSQQS